MEDREPAGRPIRVVGRYALYGKLASGGMATVHFGRLLGPAGFSRTVAIKRLHPQFAKDPEFVAMFLDEARLAARIQHPNVVATVDVVAMTEELFLVMDYIRGESFSRLLRASRKKGIDVSLGTIASVAVGMLHGLHAAHEAKDEQGQPLSVVHRDVSPQNVLVGVDGVTRVLDFGVAKAAARVQVTRDGQMKGKLAYMAPEQLQGQGVDRRTDVFAAGIVLWEALTGRRLFDAEEASEVLRMILNEDIPPPSAVVPSISRGVDAIVMRALARKPALRFQTARQFAIALEEAVHLGSPREVGEWVESVAGDTLMNREQAVAEIEMISAVSDVSLVTESEPGLMRTLDGKSPASAMPADATWDDGPTRMFDPSAPAAENEAGATRIQVPKPGSAGAAPMSSRLSSAPRLSKPPRPPPRPSHAPGPPSGPASRPQAGRPPDLPKSTAVLTPRDVQFDDENEKTNVFDPSKHGFDDENEKTNVFDPSKHGFDDENEKTNVFDPSKHGFDDENEKTNVFDPSKHGFDDENEKTNIFDPSKHAAADVSPVSRPDPTRRTNKIPSPPPSSGSTIIVQDHTDPQMFRPGQPAWAAVVDWFWANPAQRTLRIAPAAGVAALLLGFVVSGAGGARRGPNAQAAESEPAPAAPAESVAAAVPAAAAPAPAAPEPRGVDLSTLPPAEEDEKPVRAAAEAPAKIAAPPSQRATDETPQEPTPSPGSAAGAVAVPVVDLEDGDNPRPSPAKGASKPSTASAAPASPKAADPPASEAPAAPAAAPAAAKAKETKADCSQPFFVDDKKIRRIKPECL